MKSDVLSVPTHLRLKDTPRGDEMQGKVRVFLVVHKQVVGGARAHDGHAHIPVTHCAIVLTRVFLKGVCHWRGKMIHIFGLLGGGGGGRGGVCLACGCVAICRLRARAKGLKIG